MGYGRYISKTLIFSGHIPVNTNPVTYLFLPRLKAHIPQDMSFSFVYGICAKNEILYFWILWHTHNCESRGLPLSTSSPF